MQTTGRNSPLTRFGSQDLGTEEKNKPEKNLVLVTGAISNQKPNMREQNTKEISELLDHETFPEQTSL